MRKNQFSLARAMTRGPFTWWNWTLRPDFLGERVSPLGGALFAIVAGNVWGMEHALVPQAALRKWLF